MPRKNLSHSKEIEANFLAALDRLLAGKPIRSTLAAKKEVKISYSNVAVEAGHSRTLIGHDGCAYQDVRDKIKAILKHGLAETSKAEEADKPKFTESQKLINRLRAEKKDIARERDVLATQLIRAKLIISEYEKRGKSKVKS